MDTYLIYENILILPLFHMVQKWRQQYFLVLAINFLMLLIWMILTEKSSKKSSLKNADISKIMPPYKLILLQWKITWYANFPNFFYLIRTNNWDLRMLSKSVGRLCPQYLSAPEIPIPIGLIKLSKSQHLRKFLIYNYLETYFLFWKY